MMRRTVVASGTRAVVSSGTVYSRQRARAGSSLFVQRSATSVGHGARSCSDVGMSVVVASGTRAVASSGTAYGRRHLRANRLASLMVTKRLAVVASVTRVVGSSGTAYGRRRLQDRKLGRHTASKHFTVVASGTRAAVDSFGTSAVEDVCGPGGSPPLLCCNVAVVASGTRAAVDSSGTVYSRRCLRAKRLASSVVPEHFAVAASGTRVVGSSGQPTFDDVTGRRLVFLTCWNVVLSSNWDCYCGRLVWDSLRSSTSAGQAARFFGDIWIFAVDSSGTVCRSTTSRAKRLAPSVV